MREYEQFVRQAHETLQALGVLEDLQDVTSDGVYRASFGERLPWLGLPYMIDPEEVVGLFRSDYYPGATGDTVLDWLALFRNHSSAKGIGEFFLAFAAQDSVAHVIAITHEMPTPSSAPTSAQVRLAARLPISRAAEFVDTFAERVWRPHSKRTLRLSEGLESLRGVIDRATPRVEVHEITPELLDMLQDDPKTLSRLDPGKFEALVADRLNAMGMGTRIIGNVNRKDGGIDIIAWPEGVASFPFLVAVQVKHHSTGRPVGPTPVRELRGVLSQLPIQVAMLLTNMSFTADAKWVASENFIRLRDFHDLMRWIRNDFLGELEWREIPGTIQLAPGIAIEIPKWGFFVDRGVQGRKNGGT